MEFGEMYISLVVRYLREEITIEEKKELFSWVYHSAENEKLFYTLKDIWETARYHQVTKNAVTEDEWEKFALLAIQKKSKQYSNHQNMLQKLYRVAKIAALVVLAFGIGVLVQRLIPPKEEYATVHVPLGAKSKIELADGSKVWVNSGSSLKYPARTDDKEVFLYLDGEAFFEIANDPGRKVNVQTSTLNIQVLGTSFNVKSYEDEGTVETTLVKGLISITGKVGNKNLEPVLLKPNQQAKLIKGEQGLSVINLNSPTSSGNEDNRKKAYQPGPAVRPSLKITGGIDVAPVTSWKDNKMIFKNERFDYLARKMERWYNVRITIEDTLLMSSVYTGTFEKETIEQAMKALSLSLPFTYRIDKNEICVIKRNKR